jgi:colanic acid biosynthesis protein WcaH
MVIPWAEYEPIISKVPIVCVDVAIFHAGQVLLIKRASEPARGEWWLPGGRLFKGETIEACALRKAREETGLTCVYDGIIHYDNTIFDTGPHGIPIHSVNFCVRLFAPSNGVETDDTCLGHKWVTIIEPEFDPYIKKCLGKAMSYYD